jgi:hypothetical protein
VIQLFVTILLLQIIQGDSRVIMSPTELKIQLTIHLESKAVTGVEILRFYTSGAFSIDSPMPTSTPNLKKKHLYMDEVNVQRYVQMYCGLHFQVRWAHYYS